MGCMGAARVFDHHRKPVIQPEVIALALVEVTEEYDLQLLAYDHWRIADFKRELDNFGAQIPMQRFGQGSRNWYLRWTSWSN